MTDGRFWAPLGHAGVYLHSVGALPSQRGESANILDGYPERALMLAGAADVVCVGREVEPQYLEFLASLGLGPQASNVVALAGADDEPVGSLATRLLQSPALLTRVARSVARPGTIDLHPYAATPDIFALAEAMARAVPRVRVRGGAPELTAWADQKHHVRARALELGIPVADGEVVEVAAIRTAIKRHLRRTGRVIVRGACGASGSSAYVVGMNGEHADEVIASIGARSDNQIYLVETMVDVTVSPNVQMYVDPDDGSIVCIGVTDQRWGRALVHAGNILPSAALTIDAMKGWAYALAVWLRDEGYAGVVGFDFVEYRDVRTGLPRSFLAEVNPRVNGGTYPLALREQLNTARRQDGRPELAAFVSGTVETGARTFAQLRDLLGDLIYSQERGMGLVPYAPGYLSYGKCGLVALAAARPEALELYAEAEATMEPACVES